MTGETPSPYGVQLRCPPGANPEAIKVLAQALAPVVGDDPTSVAMVLSNGALHLKHLSQDQAGHVVLIAWELGLLAQMEGPDAAAWMAAFPPPDPIPPLSSDPAKLALLTEAATELTSLPEATGESSATGERPTLIAAGLKRAQEQAALQAPLRRSRNRLSETITPTLNVIPPEGMGQGRRRALIGLGALLVIGCAAFLVLRDTGRATTPEPIAATDEAILKSPTRPEQPRSVPTPPAPAGGTRPSAPAAPATAMGAPAHRPIPAAPIQSRRVQVTSAPTGATLVVDGEPLGQTPLVVALPPGVHRFKLEGINAHAPAAFDLDVLTGQGLLQHHVELSALNPPEPEDKGAEPVRRARRRGRTARRADPPVAARSPQPEPEEKSPEPKAPEPKAPEPKVTEPVVAAPTPQPARSALMPLGEAPARKATPRGAPQPDINLLGEGEGQARRPRRQAPQPRVAPLEE